MTFRSLLILSVLSKTLASNPFGTEFEIDGASTLDSLRHSENIDAQIRDLVRNAQGNTNTTRGVAFKPFEAVDTTNSALSSGDVEWTWRKYDSPFQVHVNVLRNSGVNVSDFAVPGDESYDEVVDPHIVATTYDFTWPGGGNLSAALGDTAAGLCLSFVSLPLDFPANVTELYTEGDANDPSCAPVLGQACVDAILSGGRTTSAGQPPGRCAAGRAWFELPECESTLGYALAASGSGGTNTVSLGFRNSSSGGSSNATAYDAEDGGGWYGLFSAPQNGSGSVEYYNATNRVHIAMIDPVLPSAGDTGYTQGPELLCMRVNVTGANVNGANATGGDTKDNVGNSVKLGSAAWVLSVTCLMSFAFIFIA
ncbi:hypothetical protein F4820DRAFT_399057 [Hypoxylon rubiginosum]|uniref:Uncharacterized protein n=1 Tax=Hypoxylon rubiginosum TaxID=110542 RepID=A0ACB9YUG2_9PEZI|nr:hypothetical protein F4820DRAFT_399057 [Hypoxylon rubiginosum]